MPRLKSTRNRRAIAKIPSHLVPYTCLQDPNLYTAIDHACWRYIMKVSGAFFKDHAHRCYAEGLKKTGIPTERIPLISEMDRALRKMGWRAVAVSGFIPPAVFLEFQSLGILPIACDMRKLENIAYTPAPDIVHEAAGHAPILADPEFADYLRSYGDVARRAIYSARDMEVYEAVRYLSDTKENPKATPAEIERAQSRLEKAVAAVSYVSEATYLARMAWWTTEYGLVGPREKPVIFGAGLLSSAGESYHCFSKEVKRIPFTLDCVNMSYDITRPQPQLFVTPDFKTLGRVLEQMAEGMAFRRGGTEGLAKAKASEATTTAVLDSGLQISGVLDEFHLDARGEPAFLRYRKAVALAVADRELAGQGRADHAEGFSTPVGRVRGAGGFRKHAGQLTRAEWERLGFKRGKRGKLEFRSGIALEGRLVKKTDTVATFSDCEVRWGTDVLFRPEWGRFDLACGARVVSVFGGAADRAKFGLADVTYPDEAPVAKTNFTIEQAELVELYAEVRALREGRSPAAREGMARALAGIAAKLEERYPDDWLLRVELWELAELHGWKTEEWAARVGARLAGIAARSPLNRELIMRITSEVP